MMNFLEAAGLFADCWHMYRKYYSEELQDDICEQFADEVDTLYKKYSKKEFAKNMIVVVVNEISKIDCVRRRTRKGRNGESVKHTV